MKKLIGLLIVLVLCSIAYGGVSIYQLDGKGDYLHSDNVDGFFFGSIDHKIAPGHGCLISHKDQNATYLGLYTSNPDARTMGCNLAFSVQYDGSVTMQVVDPGTKKIHIIHLMDVVRLVNSNKQEKQ